MRTICATLSIAALAIGLGACSGDSSAPSSSPVASTSTMPSPSSMPSPSDQSAASPSESASAGGFSISTPEGEASVSLDGALPEGWPTDFPLPPGAVPAGSGSLETSSSVMIGVFSTEGSGQEAFDFYAGQSSLEPAEDKSVGGSERFVGSMKISGSHPGSVTIARVKGTTHVVVVLTSKG